MSGNSILEKENLRIWEYGFNINWDVNINKRTILTLYFVFIVRYY